MSEKVHIFDTTLRDGEQSPGCSMNLEEKVRVARQLQRLNVDVLEAGFPISSEGDFKAIQAICSEVRQPTIAALARAHRPDIERAWDAIKDAHKKRIHTFIATSDIHLKYKLNKTRAQVLEATIQAVKMARDLCDDVEFSAEDATRTDFGFLVEIFEAAIEHGATVINVPDTVGYAVLEEYGGLCRRLIETIPNSDKAVFGTHTHNDLGLAVANSLSGVSGGCRQVECTLNGIGERAGNAALEEVVMVLSTRKDRFDFHTDIVATEIYPSSRLLCEITGSQVQYHKAIVGRNAFSHEAGIHQDGVLKNALTYEIMTPQSVGVESNRLVMGKHSGRHALSVKLMELGYDLSREDLDKAYLCFTRLADAQKEVSDAELAAIVDSGYQIGTEVTRKPGSKAAQIRA